MKFIKKIIAGVVLLALTVGALCFGRATMQETWAEEDSVKIDGDWSYREDGNGTASITGYGGDNTTVEIPKSIGGLKVNGIDEFGFYKNTSIKHIIIPDGVIYISDYSFFECTSLESVVIPGSLRDTGFLAFGGCTSLKNVKIQEGVTKIGSSIDNSLFADCQLLENIEIPKSVTYIAYGVFDSTKWFDDRRAENPLVIVNGLLIDGKTAKGDVVIPEGVTYIGEYAFSGNTWNTWLKSVIIPESVTYISREAFDSCSTLENVVISSNIEGINMYTFGRCKSLKNVRIPEGVKYISKYAFIDCPLLNSVEIPNSVTTIDEYAFGYGISEPIFGYEKYPDFTIYGYPDTAAETYAIENGFAFVDLTDAEEPTENPTEKPSENPTQEPTEKPTETLTDSLITFNTSGEFSPKLEMTKDEVLSAIAKYLTEEQLSSVKAGKTPLDIKLTVSNINANVSKADKDLIDKAIADLPDSDKLNFKVLDYLDIRLGAVIDGNELTIPETDGAVTVSIAPLKPANETYKVVRIHDGKAEVIDAQLDKDGTRLIFKTDRFSTYAIIYADVASGENTPSLPIIAFLLAASAVIAAGAAVAIKEFKTLGEK